VNLSQRPAAPTVADGHEISIIAVVRSAWAHKIIVGVSTAILTAAAIAYGLTATPIFQANVVVTQTHDPTFGGLGGMGGSLGGLASLAGVALGDTDQDHERMAILGSRNLVREFIQRNNLVGVLLPHPKKPATLYQAVDRFSHSVLEINEDKLKGTTTISIDWTDPHVAAQWANAYVALANDTVRARTLNVAGRSVDYLKKQVEETSMVELRRLLYDLIESQTKTLTLANARAEYAFTVVDPATEPEIRISPKRTLLALTGMVLGGLLGAIIAFLYDGLRAPDGSRRH